jgi:hypothetical protein
MSIPLLRGGPFGMIGTGPLAFQAAAMVKVLQNQGELPDTDRDQRLKGVLGSGVDEFLHEIRYGLMFVNSKIQCPHCDK